MMGIICSPPKTGQKDTEVGMIPVSFDRRTFNRVTQQMPSLVKCEGEAFSWTGKRVPIKGVFIRYSCCREKEGSL